MPTAMTTILFVGVLIGSLGAIALMLSANSRRIIDALLMRHTAPAATTIVTLRNRPGMAARVSPRLSPCSLRAAA
ncbi:MAG: hypothetical protein GW859_09960 [Sphingomonadales bacterium]|nr:hypothetical protein [Sphingomonadales bacterium]